jgi:hypothetical protein
VPGDQPRDGDDLPDQPSKDPENGEQGAERAHGDVDGVHGAIIPARAGIFKRSGLIRVMR